nr:DJ-1/PfpI family protein [Actinomycetota bacterium]
VLVADGVDAPEVEQIRRDLSERGATAEVLGASHDGRARGTDGSDVDIDVAARTAMSVVYDGVIVPGGSESARTLAADGHAVHFVAEAYKHHKPVAASDEGLEVLRRAGISTDGEGADRGVVLAASTGGTLPDQFVEQFAAALGKHREWDRDTASMPA